MDNISISFTDSVGVIRALWLGDTSISFKTINGGFSWQPFLIPIASSNNVVDFSIINSNIIYAIASNIQYKTIDAGVTWVSIRNLPYSIVGDNPFQVFDTTGIGFANCAYGTAFVRFYSDVSDTAIVNGMIFDPHSISFINADTGYLLKYDKIYKTINGGITKTIIDSFTAWRPDHVFFLNNEIGFICGQNGKIYKTTNGGTTSIQNPSLKKKLKIYPNPTSEKINLEYENDFSIESIQLLDISGKFIKSFKKNEKVLNVSGLPNGMYYLNIKAKEESAIEKIVIE